MAIRQTRELDRTVQAAVDHGEVSAVFMIPGEPISFVIGDEVVRTEGGALSAEETRDIAVAALGEDRLAMIGPETGHAQTSCALPGVVDGRMLISRSQGSCSIMIRLLQRTDLAGLAQRCGVPQELISAALAPLGLVLITGPANSGKTTTVYALLEEINTRRACHISTVEYTIGMVIPPREAIVQQREIGIDVPDALAGIQASMAQGANVLLVGEIRSPEELTACIRLAHLGRLVITQLHLPTPASALRRVCEFVDDLTREQLSRSLLAVSAQHLMPRADGEGQVAAYGLLIPDGGVRQAIAAGGEQIGIETPLPDGARSLGDDVDRLQREGIVTAEATAVVRSFLE